MVLALADKPPISALSRAHVETTTAGLKRFLQNAMWIGKRNRYAHEVVKRLKADHPLNAERKRNLAQYIAASAVLHANDGWGYLGRSIACLMTGDAHRALHLAYYAELRAGISLLAAGGIGIFNRQHFIISGANTTARLQSGGGTHEIAWAALEFWSLQPSSGTLFAKLVRPEGRTLDEWFLPHGGSGTLAPQARQWFLQWGMDLSFAIKDRNARNESSYRPDGIPTSWTVSPSAALDFVQNLWAALEPSKPSSFEGIDRHILRLALERHFHGLTNTRPSPQNAAFAGLVRDTVTAQGFSAAAETRWRNFLLRSSVPSDPTIFINSALQPGNPTTDHFAVISRAVLLLRLATGSAHDLLQQAGFDATALAFWWQSVGEARGLWNPASPPAALDDLWADVQDTLSDIQQFAADNPTALQSVNGIASGVGERFNVLCSHERVGLWGLCPS
jgi:hypothetical protein